DYMEQALSLAKLALGQVSPNPAVGAVVVKNDAVVGQGYTQPPGSWHAEISSLKQAGENTRGGTLYVTLEPCNHYGRTPPCTKAIIDAGIDEVHLAMIDPNPMVSGQGKSELEKEGLKVTVGEHEEEANEINEAYVKFISTGLPFVTAKFAMSLDGKIATRSGDSRWISGEEARKYVHHLRYISDAIMVGANTILADDPRLTTRCCGGRGGTVRKQPLRVIVDGRGRTPLSARIFGEPGNTLLALGRTVKPEDKAALNHAPVTEPKETTDEAIAVAEPFDQATDSLEAIEKTANLATEGEEIPFNPEENAVYYHEFLKQLVNIVSVLDETKVGQPPDQPISLYKIKGEWKAVV
ncbi:hypothetical protein LCGC14_3066470, partial [marine sediment metagenome]